MSTRNQRNLRYQRRAKRVRRAAQLAITDPEGLRPFPRIPGYLVPENSELPEISGEPSVGETLTASNGNWSYSPGSFSFQWMRGSAVIDGATESSYEVLSEDEGEDIRVRVRATNAAGTSRMATSLPTTIS